MATVQLSEEIKKRLLEIAAKLQIERKERVSLNEAVRLLIQMYDDVNRKQVLFKNFFGCLGGDSVEESYRILKEGRKVDEERIRRLERQHSR